MAAEANQMADSAHVEEYAEEGEPRAATMPGEEELQAKEGV